MLIDLAFKKWLQDLIGDKNYQLLEPVQRSLENPRNTEGENMRALMRNFEIHKKRFSSDSRDMHIDLPQPLENLSLANRVDVGEFTVSVYVVILSSTALAKRH